MVERALEKRLHRVVTVEDMQFGFMPKKEIIDAVFILRRMQEEYHAKGKKMYIYFVDLYRAFYRVSRKVLEWVMRKKRIPDVLVRSVMSLYEGVKTRVRVDFELSEEFVVKEGINRGSVLFFCNCGTYCH